MATIKPFINGESPISAPVSGFRKGAPEGSVNKAKNARRMRVPQKAYFKPRVSSADTPLLSTARTPPLYGPSRGSTNLSVIKPTTSVSIRTDAQENQKFDNRSMEKFGLT